MPLRAARCRRVFPSCGRRAVGRMRAGKGRWRRIKCARLHGWRMPWFARQPVPSPQNKVKRAGCGFVWSRVWGRAWVFKSVMCRWRVATWAQRRVSAPFVLDLDVSALLQKAIEGSALVAVCNSVQASRPLRERQSADGIPAGRVGNGFCSAAARRCARAGE